MKFMEEAIYEESGDTKNEKHSYTELLELADSTKNDIMEFRHEVLRNFEIVRNQNYTWINSYQAAKLLSITNRTLRRYRQKFQLRYHMVNGICKYYYPDLLGLRKFPPDDLPACKHQQILKNK